MSQKCSVKFSQPQSSNVIQFVTLRHLDRYTFAQRIMKSHFPVTLNVGNYINIFVYKSSICYQTLMMSILTDCILKQVSIVSNVDNMFIIFFNTYAIGDYNCDLNSEYSVSETFTCLIKKTNQLSISIEKRGHSMPIAFFLFPLSS